MKKILSILGVAFLAQLIFVGMIHVLLLVQGQRDGETMRSLNEMPLIGGFFLAPPASEAPLDPELEEERRMRVRLDEARRFYPSPTTIANDELNALRDELASERERYRQRQAELEQREETLKRSEEEAKTEWTRVQEAMTTLQARADGLESKRSELELRLIRISEDERDNLKRFVGMLGNMEPQAAAQLIEGTGEGEDQRGLDVSFAAKIMIQLEQRQAAKIMNAMGQAARLRLFNAMSSISSSATMADTGNR